MSRLRSMMGDRAGFGLKLAAVALLVLIGSAAARGALIQEARGERAHVLVRDGGAGYSDAELAALMADAGPGAVKIAAEHDPDAPPRDGGRPAGWARLEVGAPPSLGFERLSMDDARQVNGAMPAAQAFNPPAEPFVLKARGPEREEALKCLTAAVYYEAALEPRAGQEAVAQVVLNRLRHPGYPKSVCGVVFQGAERPGCQFSFVCDGSMARAPAAWAWRNAHDVAERALDGYVMKDVGLATHYHTSWVTAWWTPTLLKIRQIGAHIFFRPIGPDGQPSAFTARYLGGEAQSSRVNMIGLPGVATSAPAMLLKVSVAGSVVAPRSAVRDGRMIVLPGSTLFLTPGRAGRPAAPGAFAPPMHAMIAMRAAAARANRSVRPPPSFSAELAAAPAPAYMPPPDRPAPRTVAVKGGFEAVAPDPAPAG